MQLSSYRLLILLKIRILIKGEINTMEQQELCQYIINKDTTAIISDFDAAGNEHSIVIEGEKQFRILKSPTRIVRDSFAHRGYDLKGAIAGARAILKKKKNVPIAYSLIPEVVLILCKKNDGTGVVWLVRSQIEEIEMFDRRQTLVRFKTGFSLFVNMSHSLLQMKIILGSHLHRIMLERSGLGSGDPYYFRHNWYQK